MKTWLLFGWLFGGSADVADFAGTYAVRGDAPNGAYTATLEIIAHGDLAEVVWTFPGCDYMVGVGVVRDDALLIGYEPAGVMLYRRTSTDHPRTMEGTYAGFGFDQMYPEAATETPPQPPCQPVSRPLIGQPGQAL